MTRSENLPQDIHDAIKVIRDLRRKAVQSKAEKDNLNRAKLRIAFWACRQENIPSTRENLSYVLGADATEIMGAYDRYLEREDDKSSAAKHMSDKDREAKDNDAFWKNA